MLLNNIIFATLLCLSAAMALVPSLDWATDPRSTWMVNPAGDPLTSTWMVNPAAGFGGFARVRNEAIQPLAPLMSADLIEKENQFEIHVDIPGVENIDITTEGNFLTITADRKVLHERDTAVAHTVERSYGKVRRRLVVPNNANIDEARARFIDGVLTVTMPKKESGVFQKKHITIE